ncbi:MAG: hydantoinase B/oxoprolinase family protein [bacterium]
MNDFTLSVHEQVIDGGLRTLTREMGHRLKRSAHSSLIRESDDYGAAYVSPNFELVAETETTPLQMGPLAGYCKGLIDVLKERNEEVDPGAVYLHNDPYRGASHSPDVGAILPLEANNRRVGFVCTAAHHLDLGAAVPGTCIIRAHDDYSEGLRIRAIKVERADETQIETAWNLIKDNVRIPELVTGDLRAQVKACRWGQSQFHELLDRFGLEEMESTRTKLLSNGEQRMKKVIRGLPDKRLEATGYLDGYVDNPDAPVDIPIHLQMDINGSEINVNFDGTASQLDHRPINMPFRGTTDMAVSLTLRTILLPETEYPKLPHNSGLFRPVSISAPEGSLVHPTFPAPTIGRFCGGQMVSNLVVKCLSEILPERVCAGCATTKAVTFSGQSNSEDAWVYMDVTEGAYGGSQDKDGMDAVDVLYANTKNNPIEDIENQYPLRVERYELREGTAGDGQFRGGFGPVRETRFLTDGNLSVEGDGFRHPPWGLKGGEDGATGGVEIKYPEEETPELLPSKIDNLQVPKGTIIRDLCPSGGGFGNPDKRSEKLRQLDLKNDLTN